MPACGDTRASVTPPARDGGTLMPGLMWRVWCDACRASWEVSAGVSVLETSRRPANCTRCRAIVTAEKVGDTWRCEGCEEVVELLPEVKFEPERERPNEIRGAACPRCSHDTLRAEVEALWD